MTGDQQVRAINSCRAMTIEEEHLEVLPARVGAVVRRLHPAIGLGCTSAAIACDLPVVARVLLWLLAIRYLLLRLAAPILDPLLKWGFKARRRPRCVTEV